MRIHRTASGGREQFLESVPVESALWLQHRQAEVGQRPGGRVAMLPPVGEPLVQLGGPGTAGVGEDPPQAGSDGRQAAAQVAVFLPVAKYKVALPELGERRQHRPAALAVVIARYERLQQGLEQGNGALAAARPRPGPRPLPPGGPRAGRRDPDTPASPRGRPAPLASRPGTTRWPHRWRVDPVLPLAAPRQHPALDDIAEDLLQASRVASAVERRQQVAPDAHGLRVGLHQRVLDRDGVGDVADRREVDPGQAPGVHVVRPAGGKRVGDLAGCRDAARFAPFRTPPPPCSRPTRSRGSPRAAPAGRPARRPARADRTAPPSRPGGRAARAPAARPRDRER